MLRHHSLGPAELVTLMAAWRHQPIAEAPRFRRIIAFDAVSDDVVAVDDAPAPPEPRTQA